MAMKKAPEAKLPFGFNYSNWLDEGETITDATWTPDPANPDTNMSISANPEPSVTGAVVTCWLEGGTPDNWYRFTVQVTTSLGKTDERALHVACEEP